MGNDVHLRDSMLIHYSKTIAEYLAFVKCYSTPKDRSP